MSGGGPPPANHGLGAIIGSHEALTDPVPGQGWHDDVHGKIVDICA